MNATSPSSCVAFIDGACQGNPGPGGWGCILELPFLSNETSEEKKILELGGRVEQTTNNQMELYAALAALNAVHELRPKKSLKVYTDSKYVIQGITNWIFAWRNRGWKKSQWRSGCQFRFMAGPFTKFSKSIH